MNVWVFQTGEPLMVDDGNRRPMRAMNLTSALVDRGHNIQLISSAFFHQEKIHRSRKYKLIRVSEHLNVHLIPSPGYKKNIGFGRLFDHFFLAKNINIFFKNQMANPDIVFIGYPPIETAAVLTRWCKERGIPCVLDVKDQWPTIFLDPLPKFLKGIARILLYPYFYYGKRAMKEASALTAMAPSFLDWAMKFSNSDVKNNNGVFPLTSSLSEYPESQISEAESWWDDVGVHKEQELRIMFVGSFMSVFDFKEVAIAAKLLNQDGIKCQFVLCGDGGSVNKIKAEFSDVPNVIFPGWIDGPKIVALARRSNLFIAPYKKLDSFERSIPNKVIDALSLGLPILTPLGGEVGALLKNYNVGMIYESININSLEKCIKEFVSNVSLMKVMSKNSLHLYDKKFSSKKKYDEFVDYLESFVDFNADIV